MINNTLLYFDIPSFGINRNSSKYARYESASMISPLTTDNRNCFWKVLIPIFRANIMYSMFILHTLDIYNNSK